MHNMDLILTLTGGLAAALLFGYGTHRLGLSPIVGYLLAGIAVGPSTPGFVANRDIAGPAGEMITAGGDRRQPDGCAVIVQRQVGQLLDRSVDGRDFEGVADRTEGLAGRGRPRRPVGRIVPRAV